MKKVLLPLIIAIFIGNVYSQTNDFKLSDKFPVTYKDLLDLKLQILSAQMTCGSYEILDMGTLGFPISIEINDKDQIIFNIKGNINKELSNGVKKEVLMEGFVFANTGISELIRTNFPHLLFDAKKDIIGFWYLEGASIPIAKYINETFEWIEK